MPATLHVGARVPPGRWSRAKLPQRCPRILPALAGIFVLLASAAHPLVAQQAPATLEVIVIEGSTSQPIRNAQVTLSGGGGGVTDTYGVLQLRDLPGSTVSMEVRHLGYAPQSIAAQLTSGEITSITVVLELQPVELSGVRAEVRSSSYRSRLLREFYTRTRTGAGQYITRADIDAKKPRNLTDVFRMLPGIKLTSTAIGDKPVMDMKTSAMVDRLGNKGNDCPIQYFLDGTPFLPSHGGLIGLDIPPNEIEGIEIYRRGSGVPVKYHRANNNCGVILIWKRERI